ncbi:right-handed parallel beta-helix repeat-containing protein [Paenibacillus polysaccharolyticus]|uniref:right-handed parallel beta-helix repeat-containing protein n=1 Tax=Paenibacillus polysaccharolyticus TaxID=582692 RepID=UPI00203FD5D7|nr:right-handed parallel beta-helix repeat-containing protein [Paenibacillus polysaccharolyticus]MCM3133370.1 right-handed parallel beta-helix repeat-containing protein [Paenibacillus polysaccharolyticus]
MFRFILLPALILTLFTSSGCQDRAFSIPQQPDVRTETNDQTIYYISPQGNDKNPGTVHSPWKTIQYAADHASPGSTIYLRQGVYPQKVKITRSGLSSSKPTLISSYPGEKAILDGKKLSVRGVEGMVELDNVSHVTISNLEIRGFSTTQTGQVPVGIYVHGAGENVQLLGNQIHAIASRATPKGDELQGRDAHGIAIYGTEHPQALRDIIIKDNKLYDLVLGSSESLAVNGNVDTFAIINNTIHDTDNIGIDLIGYEGISEDDAYDRARNGIVRGNTIYNITSTRNPSYGLPLPNKSNSAGAIYVDGGTHHIIDRNKVYRNDIGIEIASEHAGRSTSNITVRDNLIYANRLTGIAMGGYDEERGATENSQIMYNTIADNDTLNAGNGQLLIQSHTRNNTFTRNIVAAGSSDVLIHNEYTSNAGNMFDHNLYYVNDEAQEALWVWKNESYSGVTAYQQGTGNDTHSRYVNPAFVNSSKGDYRLRTGSPAKAYGYLAPR